MRPTAVSMLRLLLTLGVCLFPSIVIGQEQASPVVSPAAASFASRYLQAVDKSFSFPSADGGEDFVFVGHSRGQSSGWRVIVVAGSRKPRLAWDSFTLNDPYLNVIGLSSISAEANGLNGYTVALRGCIPHECADGRIGFAVYASSSQRAYRSHVLTKDDGSYGVTFYPKSGIPESYRSQLDRMMCTDSGISQPSALPVKCAPK
jgi:hypothetical protein